MNSKSAEAAMSHKQGASSRWPARNSMLAGAVALSVVAAMAVAVLLWRTLREPSAPGSGDPVALAKFASSGDFERLEEPQRRRVAQDLRKQTDALDAAYSAGRLSKEQYEQASLCAWMARQLDHMDDYYSQPEARRMQYLLEERARKNKQAAASPAAEAQERFSDEAQDEYEEQWTKRWPSEQLGKWQTYRAAVKKAKAAASARS